ncbi:MAG: IS3 family transposase, partial [Anaerolineales bacterium]|nr:IS3 family transposase [Anaerolineales bacterium]
MRTQQGWAYLSTIKDLFDGFIVAHQFERSNSIGLVTKTVKQSQQKEKVIAGIMPPCQNFFGHLKEEAIRKIKNPTFQQAQQIIDDYAGLTQMNEKYTENKGCAGLL